jgi:exodeoxyribonuclease VII large subunit
LREAVVAKVQRQQLAIGWLLKERRERWKRLTSALLQVSPQSTLARGYAIVREPPGEVLVRTAAQARGSSSLLIEFADGSVEVDVKRGNRF